MNQSQDVNRGNIHTSSFQTPNSASRSAPVRVSRKTAIPRQDNIFKRFTDLLVDFFKRKFVWAKANKSQIDPISEEHDKRISQNYVYDEVLGYPVLRTEYEKQAKFNQDGYKPTPYEISRFPNRPKFKPHDTVQSVPQPPSLQARKSNVLRPKPPDYWK